jgi:plasmid stabilization system protein ParE
MKYAVRILNSAKVDLLGIKKYLSQFYPGTTKRFINEFNERKKALEENPYMFQVHMPAPQYRRVIVGDYLVFYKVFDPVDNQIGRVEIYRILRGSSDINNVIKSEDTQ